MFCLEDTFHLINGENQLDEQTSQHHYLPFNEIKVNFTHFYSGAACQIEKKETLNQHVAQIKRLITIIKMVKLYMWLKVRESEQSTS
jgi:hypothetical protein